MRVFLCVIWSISQWKIHVYIFSFTLWTGSHCNRRPRSLPFPIITPHTSCKCLLYSQFLRICRICSRKSDLVKYSLILAEHFERWGYPDKIISKTLTKASCQNEADLLKDVKSVIKTHIISPSSLEFDGLRPIIEINFEFLNRSQAIKSFADSKLAFCFRRLGIFCDLLVRKD